jgi:hypothetical protein
MIGTSASGTYDITSCLTNSPHCGSPDLSMGSRCGELCHGHAHRTLDRHTGDATWVGACPPDNIGWEITPPAHNQRLIGNRFCDSQPLLRLSTL